MGIKMKILKRTILMMVCVCIMVSPLSIRAESLGHKGEGVDGKIEIESLDLTTDEISKEYVEDGIPNVPIIPESPRSARKVIGQDDRVVISDTKAAPYRYIGRLAVHYTNSKGSWIGSGTAFLVAPKLIVTAAHCVYPVDSKTGEVGKITKVMFYPGRNGNSNPYGSAQATKLHIPTGYKNNPERSDRKYDYAVLELNTDIGNKTGYFNYKASYLMGTSSTAEVANSVKVTLTGYPGNMSTSDKQKKHSGKATFINDSYLVTYKIDTEGGQSGSPLYWKNGDKYEVFGIHVAGSTSQNSGRRLTNAVINLITKYK